METINMVLHTGSAGAYCVQALRHSEPLFNAPDFSGWHLDYTQLSAGQYAGASQEVRFDGLQICLASWNASLHQRGAVRSDAYVFGLPCGADGEGRLIGQFIGQFNGRFNGRRWRGEIAVFRGSDEFDTVVPPMALLVVRISRAVFDAYLAANGQAAPPQWLERGGLLEVEPGCRARACEVLTAMIGVCLRDSARMACPQVRAAMMQTALEALAPLVCGDTAPGPGAPGGHSRMRIVRRAREFTLAHLDEPLQIIDVCRALGISRRSLQYSFQDVLNVNPLAYLRLLRLNGARRDLLNAAARPVQVQDVIARWGFWHFSRFSAEYKKMFKELPSETLGRALQAAAPPRVAGAAGAIFG